ncbi:hypothetical protein NDU88_005651 [Pleurodeles waltl]|uniref:Uncharacterized protein n=1 Tax=Pleurodeles waltl TaxID=8319 RepID=A0AAV7RJP2_PLEWA|nr:hypothetical protein NDU88_005651 [Pleurodeles waltl]
MDKLAIVSISQDYMTHFLQEINSEIGSLNADFKSCLWDLEKDVSKIEGSVDDLEYSVDTRPEDQEMIWCCAGILEDLQIELQAKQEDLEIRRFQNKLQVILEVAEEDDILNCCRRSEETRNFPRQH